MLQPIHGHVQVDFHYSVHFTQDLFAPDNSLFSRVVNAADADKATRVLWVVDRAVDTYCDVKSRIETYFAARPELELAGEVLLLEGGENIKNRPELVLEIQSAVNRTGLDRHSYIAVVGRRRDPRFGRLRGGDFASRRETNSRADDDFEPERFGRRRQKRHQLFR